MEVSIESMLIVARLDEMGVLDLCEGQTLADIAMALDLVQQGEVDETTGD